jgi:hypothetical protein
LGVRNKDRGLSRALSGEGVPLKAHDALRVEITKDLRDRLFAGDLKGEPSELSAHTGLPYSLVYNLVRGRIHSLSVAEYRRIFGEAPPEKEPRRVKGEYFRGMARLWIFLNRGITEKVLYREFYQGRRSLKKANYRIFNGATKTVEGRLEKAMEQKFLSQGLDRSDIIRWILELDQSSGQERVPYEEAKPVLQFMHETLGIHPSHLLRRGLSLYENGQLKSISKRLHDDLLTLKEKTEKALAAGSRLELERLKEGVYGKRKNLILFSEVEEDLQFLHTRAGIGSKKYLGRSAGKYRRSLLKRIASWRAKKIRADCDRVIAENKNFPLLSLPARHFAAKAETLLSALRSLVVHRMIADKSLDLEGLVMTPTYHTKEEYEGGGHGFSTLQEAATFLGMKQRAFDLLVAAHRDIFMRIMMYEKMWLIPDLYLKELSEKEGFSLVKAKYELLARKSMEARRTVHPTEPEKAPPRHRRTRAGSSKQPISGEGSHKGFLLKNLERDAGVLLVGGYTLHSPGSHLEAWS